MLQSVGMKMFRRDLVTSKNSKVIKGKMLKIKWVVWMTLITIEVLH